MSLCQYRKSHCGDKTVVRSSYLNNGNSYFGKMTSLYWINPHDSTRLPIHQDGNEDLKNTRTVLIYYGPILQKKGILEKHFFRRTVTPLNRDWLIVYVVNLFALNNSLSSLPINGNVTVLLVTGIIFPFTFKVIIGKLEMDDIANDLLCKWICRNAIYMWHKPFNANLS